MLNQKKDGFLVLLVMVVFLSIGLVGCGGGDSGGSDTGGAGTPAADTGAVKQEAPAPTPPAETPPADTGVAVPEGWQTVSIDQFKISLPKDWNGDKGAGVWWPGEGSLAMGRPPVSLHCGAMPVMPNTTVEQRIKGFINGDPVNKADVTVCGMNGMTGEWVQGSYKHFGIFVTETGSGMKIIYFANCQAPIGSFDAHKEVFKKIIATFRCK